MKTQAIYHLNNLIESFGYVPNNIKATKTLQSNKKPCYLVHFDLDKCFLSGFIFQDSCNEWIFNFNQSTLPITQELFIERVKEAEYLQKKSKRFIEKQAKINLSHEDIKTNSKNLKEARNFKSNNL